MLEQPSLDVDFNLNASAVFITSPAIKKAGKNRTGTETIKKLN